MQIRNNYDKNVFNGDIGYVNAVDTTERTLTVIYDGRLVEYDVSELDELTLAYAVTIHKSQGSEFRGGHARDDETLRHAPAQPHLHRHNPRQENLRTRRHHQSPRIRHPQQLFPDATR